MWTRGKKRERQIALGVGIALTAGMIGAPTAFGAPVLDTSKGTGGIVSGGATVTQNVTNAAENLKDTTIASNTQNNVIAWQDFSVKNKENVNFDDKNYMNIVTGDNTSTIDGVVKGTGDVYLVNPNGVIFGKTARVNVGNLYISTRNVDVSKAAAVNTASGNLSALVNTSVSGLAADVVNLGTVQATSVSVEAGNVRFLDASQVTSDGKAALGAGVTIRAGGDVHIGYRGNYDANYDAKYQVKNLAGGAKTAEHYNVVTSDDWQTKIQAMPSGRFLLDGDIDAKGGAGVTATFTGKLDGMGSAFRNVAFDRGLFAETNGATIENVGIASGTITGASVSSDSEKGGGSFVGNATNTTLKNVYNLVNVNSKDSEETGGIVGVGSGVTIENAYNAGNVNGFVFIGYLKDTATNTITNSYSTGTATQNCLVYGGDSSAGFKISNVYAKADDVAYLTLLKAPEISSLVLYNDSKVGTKYYGTDKTAHTYDSKLGNPNPSILKKSTFTTGVGIDKGPEWTSISNTGAVTRNADGSTSRAAWRIYENQTGPMLTSLMKGVKTISYDYTQGDAKGTNSGKDLSLTYNAKDVAFSNIDYGSADASLIHRGKTTLHDANVVNSDKVNTVGTAYFYSDPLGYDLVGGNVTVRQREVTIKSDLPMKAYAREYDGTADASGAIDAMFAGDGTSAEGIIAGDATVSLDTTQATARFAKQEGGDWKDDADVGANKTILLNGTVTLKNADGHNNYVLSSDSTSFNNRTFTDAGNKITQKALYVDFAAGKGTGINREYDGVKNTAVADAYLPTKDTFALSDPIKRKAIGSDGQATEQAEDVSLVYDSAANYVDAQDTATGKAGDYTNRVKYTGLKLTGAQAKNYYLVYGSKDNAKGTLYQEAYNGVGQDVNKDAGGAIYGSGAITKKNLTSQDYFWMKDGAFQDAAREYTGKSAYQDPVGQYVSKKGSAGLVAGDDLHFVVTGADFVDGQGSDTTTKDVGTAKAVKYAIRVEGADAENYTLNGKDIQASDAASLWGEGTLTPRTINLSVDPAKKATKTYDASDDVKSTDGTRTDLSWDDGFLTYAIDDDAHKLVQGDTDRIVYTGKYKKTGNDAEAKDVNYDAAGQTLDKDIAYTVKILHADGTASTNYRIVEGTGTSTANATELTMTGKDAGRIDPKKLTDVKFASVSKKFDGSAALGNYADYTADGTTYHDSMEYAVKNGTASGLYGAEKLEDVIDAAKLEGIYGEGATAAGFAANEHVHRTDAPTEKAHDVMYRGKGGADFLTALKNHNYTIGADSFAAGGTLDGGAYIEAKAGAIDPTTVDNITIGLKGAITKVYDGTTKILAGGNEVADYRSLLTDLSAKLPNGKSIDLSYTVVTDGDKTPVYDSKNVVASGTKDRNITFYLKVDESGDIALAKSLHAAATEAEEQALGYNLKTDRSTFQGTITPRELQVKASGKTADRAYDRTDQVRAGGRTDLTLNDGYVTYRNADDAAHHLVQGEEDALVIRGTYQKTNSERAGKDVSYDAKGGLAQKDITYAFSFKDEDAKNNYTIAPTTVTGKGTITPLGLTINVNPMTKTYDGTNALSDANKASITLTNPELKGLVAQDAVALNTDRLKKATYGSERAGETNVTYQLELVGDDKGNFYIQKSAGDADNLVKNGTGANATYTLTTKNNYISPLALKDADIWFDFQGITKVYDGSADVDYDHTGWDFGQEGKKTAQDFVRHLTIGSKANDLVDRTGAFQKGGSFSSRARYADENVGTKNVQYSFTLDKAAAGNYVWDDVTFHTTGADGSVTLTKDAQGTITPQHVLAALDGRDIHKTYDGTNAFVGVTDGAGRAVAASDLLSFRTSSGKGLLSAPSITATLGDTAAGDVKEDAGGAPAYQQASYTVNLGSGNYDLFYGQVAGQGTAGTADLVINGQGKILPKEIRALDFADVTKTYDGKTGVGTNGSQIADALRGTAAGLVKSQTLSDLFDAALLAADYGDGAADGSFSASSNVRRASDGSVAKKDVGYRAANGAALSDALKKNALGGRNYKLSDALNKKVYVEAQGGTITPLSLNLDDAMQAAYAQPITRVFESGSTKVAYDHTGWLRQKESAKAGDYIEYLSVSDGVTGEAKLYENAAGFTVKDAEYIDPTGDGTAHVDTTKSAKFVLTLAGDSAKRFDNYELTSTSGKNAYDVGTHTLTLLAENGAQDAKHQTIQVAITPQQAIAVARGEVERAYDGTTDLYGARTDAGHEGEAAAKDAIESLVDIQSSDGKALSAKTLTGAFSQKDVKWNKADNPANPYIENVDLQYKATLGTNDYDLYDGNTSGNHVSGTAELSFVGKNQGTITPFVIKNVDFGFAEAAADKINSVAGNTTANKAYDGRTDVKELSATFTGTHGESMVITNADNQGFAEGSRIRGTYGKFTGGGTTEHVVSGGAIGDAAASGTFTEDGSVNYDASKGTTEADHTGYKAVRYGNLDAAMKAKANGTGGFLADNYTIADTVYFKEEAAKGKIRRLALSAGDIEANWVGAAPSKEYDGTPDITEDITSSILSIHTKTGVTGAPVDIKYDIDESESKFSQSDVGANLDAQIKIERINAADVGNNFVMDNSASALDKLLTDVLKDAKIGDAADPHLAKIHTAAITPRVLTYHLKDKSNGADPSILSKIYDGTQDASKFHDNLVIDRGVLNKDKNLVTIDWSEAYRSKDATSTQGKATGKAAIDYTLTLSGNGTGNYTFDASKKNAGDKGEAQETATAEAYGDIWKRKVYYDFEGGRQATDIDREYNGAADVSVPDSYKDLVVLQGKTETTGIIDGTGIDRAALTVSYDAGGVIRDASDHVARNAHDVTFSNIALTDGKNYELAAADSAVTGGYAQGGALVGKGTILPKTIKIRTDGTKHDKVYDGTTTVYQGGGVDAAHRNNDGRTALSDIAGAGIAHDALVAGDTLNLRLDKALYESANAGTDAIDYTISWDNTNYDLEADAPGATKEKNGLSGTFTLHNGAIEKRAVHVTAKKAEKTYDGTRNLSDAARFLTADNLVGRDTADLRVGDARFAEENAADSEDADEKMQRVTYAGITAGNGNYAVASPDATGDGVIHRRTLTATADTARAYVGDALPAFTGRVTGFLPGEGQASDFTFVLDTAEVPTQPGSYGVYGWYGGRTSGNYGKNYTFSQAEGNKTAFTLELLDPGKEYHEIVDYLPVTPDANVYENASKDMSGIFSKLPTYAVEYPAGEAGNGVDYEALTHSSSVAAQLAEGGRSSTGTGAAGDVLQEDSSATRAADAALKGRGVINLEGGDAMDEEELLERLFGKKA